MFVGRDFVEKAHIRPGITSEILFGYTVPIQLPLAIAHGKEKRRGKHKGVFVSKRVTNSPTCKERPFVVLFGGVTLNGIKTDLYYSFGTI